VVCWTRREGKVGWVVVWLESQKVMQARQEGLQGEYMLQRLKRPHSARDLPGGGGEVKELRADRESEVDMLCAAARYVLCSAARAEMQSRLCAAVRPLAEVQQQHRLSAMGRTDGDGG
jgi:hypothetical protein